jgi:hypothetical protein
MSKTEIYDNIIIGAGIAGLYAAYLIRKHTKQSVIILEKNPKSGLGGRIGTEMFYGVEIKSGAGIGRITDKVLIGLLREFGFPIEVVKSTIEYSPVFTENNRETIDVMKTVRTLRKIYKESKNENNIETRKKIRTFREFAIEYLGLPLYKKFIERVGYQDYENTDIEEALYHYGFEDTVCCGTTFYPKWREFIHKLYEFIGKNNFRFSQNIEKIHPINIENNIYQIISDSGNQYLGKRIIIATTITGIRKLLPQYPIYREISGQPYLRLYGKFSKTSSQIMAEQVSSYLVVPGIIQKVIPINSDKGVYMICYNDNSNAILLFKKKRTENTAENRRFFERELEKAIGIPDSSLELIAIKSFFWEIGTHYYSPLDRNQYKTRNQFIKDAQTPAENILVVGEMVSRKQGWTEGALESVEKAFQY